MDVLEGGPITGDGPAAVFIDRFGFGGFGGFHGGYGGFHAGYGGFHGGYVGGDFGEPGTAASAPSASGTDRTSIAAPGTAVSTLARRR